ncbi:MAG: 2-C-methyl-D-erythritol 4-phosphate cytidylyltransferase [Puniceicoccales bacterium]|jgi:2-C-methyl-D-erythritol 4-phosphate cytidylyltransferase|nr:2-C-methyl-D-erythritol 4-phosphate cytidylyltransferase [Puniceicoccales bacterium]
MSHRKENHAIILAAGSGSRFGGIIPKQFLRINDKPLLNYSLETFLDNEYIDSVTVVLPRDFINFPLPSHAKLRHPVLGGEERYESAICALDGMRVDDDANIIIHDAARPLVPPELIGEVCKSLDSADLVTPVVEISDAIIDVGSLFVVDRSNYAAVQTPQGFRYDMLRSAMAQVDGRDMAQWPTPSCEFEIVRVFFPSARAKLIAGHWLNHKITSERDICLLKQFFADRKCCQQR